MNQLANLSAGYAVSCLIIFLIINHLTSLLSFKINDLIFIVVRLSSVNNYILTLVKLQV